MSATSLEELKKKQLQRRQQREKTSGVKRKRDSLKPAPNDTNRSLNAYFAKPLAHKSNTAPTIIKKPPTTLAVASALKRAPSASPFAAAPRCIKQNPFDIIDEAISTDDVFISGELSSSDAESDVSDYENDPSLYRLEPTTAQPSIAVAGNNEVGMQIDNEVNSKTLTPESATKKDSNEAKRLAFGKPLESLSLRSQLLVSSDSPLDSLEALQSDQFLSLTSLCSHPSGPLSHLADSLIYYEATESPAKSLTSLYYLQLNSPSRYPFVYLCARDYTVVFKMIPEPSGFRSVAVISQSHLGLRKSLRERNIDFSVPLAPRTHVKSKWYLETSAFDKTWRSALLLMGENVSPLFEYFKQDGLENSTLYSTNPFLNAMMRQASVRFSNAMTYENSGAKNVYRMDIAGIVFPSSWNAILKALAEILGEFVVAAKESSSTAHLNLLVSKQASSVAGKRTVTFSNGKFIYS
ncbi:hypothetical protein GGI25_003654 [Coemansia spiralis]|uniref:Uncharacterized protein n=2 Tax=Coemansia TaxID=4863 RepID=A0A9W8G887_9FUNG|nr:hypothetical protein BX070DRAFT_221908 [Coemansia spiralis]KAJ1996116.1 hypothetical protein EDC05_000006 [Coemansia umbellata]KAJ2626126.1 hypothetical protein GGI26_000210 [Coemansia sp. RSA 1358]KAJ2676267.1 hypothetical protein GGI25_003654 [Coemansia spiralis]